MRHLRHQLCAFGVFAELSNVCANEHLLIKQVAVAEVILVGRAVELVPVHKSVLGQEVAHSPFDVSDTLRYLMRLDQLVDEVGDRARTDAIGQTEASIGDEVVPRAAYAVDVEN